MVKEAFYQTLNSAEALFGRVINNPINDKVQFTANWQWKGDTGLMWNKKIMQYYSIDCAFS